MRCVPVGLLLAALALAGLSARAEAVRAAEPPAGTQSAAAGVEFFEARIRPVLVEHCAACHAAGAKKLEGKLRLDTPDGIRRGGESGPIVVPGKPESSPLLAALAYDGSFVDMPPRGRLPDRVVADFRAWIARGALLPMDSTKGPAPTERPPLVIDAAAREFWSFRPLQSVSVPEVADHRWPRTPVDRFVLARLEAHRLRPAPAADRRTLLRRAWFDLIGLPPSIAEVEDFAADESPDAYERRIERLLASPRYGERWGRHWLDVARYAEDHPTGEATCPPPRFPFRYRDWVVRAFNEDLPYDEFVRRQLAADRMPGLPRAEIAATGFLGLSPVYHKEPKLAADVIATIVADEWDERIDTITRGLLGLTVACARCHDHKFDPIRSQDYYALAGVLAGTRLVEWPLVDVPEFDARRLQDVREARIDVALRLSYAKEMRETAEKGNLPTEQFEEPIRRLEASKKLLDEAKLFDGPIAAAVTDAGLWIDGHDPAWTALDFRPGEPRDLPVFLRGNPARPGEIVPRRFLEVLSPGPPRPFRDGSGRRELADAIVSDAAGLTARVFANRVWGWHFGHGLVRTPGNFGALGERPTHPELLEHLAHRFVADGWSLKSLHREIVLSATYRQASVHRPAPGETDPRSIDGDDRLLWRMPRRRLEPEAWRDAVLSVAGRLDPSMTGPSANLDDDANVRRTLYGKVSRQTVADVLRLFDFPDAKQHAEQRTPTTTPVQHLYLLNSPFLHRHAAAVAERVAKHESPAVDAPDTDDARADRGLPVARRDARIRVLFRTVLQRDPTGPERDAARRLVDGSAPDEESSWKRLAHALLAGNEFLHVD